MTIRWVVNRFSNEESTIDCNARSDFASFEGIIVVLRACDVVGFRMMR